MEGLCPRGEQLQVGIFAWLLLVSVEEGDDKMQLFADGFKELRRASEPIYKTPKSIQETIEILAVSNSGIFEVAKNRYSKSYYFQDINYAITSEEEQEDIFDKYCKFLNSMDCSFKITINNKNRNMEEMKKLVMIPYADNEHDLFRKIYNDIIEE